MFTTSVVAAAACGRTNSTRILQIGFRAGAEVQQVQGRGSQPELTECDEFCWKLITWSFEDDPVEAGIKSNFCWNQDSLERDSFVEGDI